MIFWQSALAAITAISMRPSARARVNRAFEMPRYEEPPAPDESFFREKFERQAGKSLKEAICSHIGG